LGGVSDIRGQPGAREPPPAAARWSVHFRLSSASHFAFTLSWRITRIVPAITAKAPTVRTTDSISAMGDVTAAA
jgi:hypothetical protein